MHLFCDESPKSAPASGVAQVEYHSFQEQTNHPHRQPATLQWGQREGILRGVLDLSMAILEKMTPSPPRSAVERFQKEDSRCSAKHRSRMQQQQGKGREFEIHIQYIRIHIAEQSGIHHGSWWPDQRCLSELQGMPRVVALPIRSGISQTQERGDCGSDCQRGGRRVFRGF